MITECQCFFLDKATLQNVKGTTRLIVNPDVPEVIAFKDRYVTFYFAVFNSILMCILMAFLFWNAV